MPHLTHLLHTTRRASVALLLMSSTLLAAEPALIISFTTEQLAFGPGDIADASPIFDQNNKPTVAFRMSAVKARKFGAMTAKHVGEKIDLVVCGKIISSPIIREPILGGSGQVSGKFSLAEAEELALKLKKGKCD
jgi:preprotein translocase subunit SecD